MNNQYKQTVIRLIEKTNNPAAPFAIQKLATGIEQTASVLVPLCSGQEAIDLLADRLLAQFSDKELNEDGIKPDFILAVLAILKTSIVGFGQK